MDGEKFRAVRKIKKDGKKNSSGRKKLKMKGEKISKR